MDTDHCLALRIIKQILKVANTFSIKIMVNNSPQKGIFQGIVNHYNNLKVNQEGTHH